MATTNSTGYGPRRGLLFDSNESKNEPWEVKFLGYVRLYDIYIGYVQKLYDVFVRLESEKIHQMQKNKQIFLLNWFNVWTTEVCPWLYAM